MQCGRVPVIVSDDWVPPKGPTWERFSIRVSEANVQNLPNLLKQNEPEWRVMGRRAREEWEKWFSPANYLQGICGQLEALVIGARRRERHARAVLWPLAMGVERLRDKRGFRRFRTELRWFQHYLLKG